MNTLLNQKTKTKGLSLIELITYTAVAGIFLVLVLSILNSFLKSRNTAKKLSLLQDSLVYVFNDLTQEIHWSDDAIPAGDELTLIQTQLTNGETEVEITYKKDGDQLLKEGAPFLPTEVKLNSFKVKNVAEVDKIKCLTIKLELEYAGSEPKIMAENETTISLRKTKFQSTD